MNWKFIDSGLNTGLYNMDFDLMLAKSLKPDEAILRLYGWKPYCISLGANQPEDSLDIEKVIYNKLDFVKRPTGGRAILHAEELTYSVIYPSNKNFSLNDLYKQVNLALKKGLALFDEKLKEVSLEYKEPHFPSFYKEEKSALCFAVSSRNEINYNGKKLIGSAQRNLGKVILQHGSILCGDYHKKIVDYLALNKNYLDEIREEIITTTTDLNEILNYKIEIGQLKSAIKKGFEKKFGFNFYHSEKEFDLALSTG
jgi:lipoate-protein ligase A